MDTEWLEKIAEQENWYAMATLKEVRELEAEVTSLNNVVGLTENERDKLEATIAELDDMLVVSHLGTLDSFESLGHAVRALVEFDLSAEKYFDKVHITELEAILREIANIAHYGGLMGKDNSDIRRLTLPYWDKAECQRLQLEATVAEAEVEVEVLGYLVQGQALKYKELREAARAVVDDGRPDDTGGQYRVDNEIFEDLAILTHPEIYKTLTGALEKNDE